MNKEKLIRVLKDILENKTHTGDEIQALYEAIKIIEQNKKH